MMDEYKGANTKNTGRGNDTTCYSIIRNKPAIDRKGEQTAEYSKMNGYHI